MRESDVDVWLFDGIVVGAIAGPARLADAPVMAVRATIEDERGQRINISAAHEQSLSRPWVPWSLDSPPSASTQADWMTSDEYDGRDDEQSDNATLAANTGSEIFSGRHHFFGGRVAVSGRLFQNGQGDREGEGLGPGSCENHLQGAGAKGKARRREQLMSTTYLCCAQDNAFAGLWQHWKILRGCFLVVVVVDVVVVAAPDSMGERAGPRRWRGKPGLAD
ncbi:uncharacterized protein BKA78DRAFT_299127 [Phyllosticta capitalensis]|uniref:Uncharacterized protein n=1 Tax=Phyllosticta capitalensis TaxID=121624 RepID=A0ABR1YHF5_9PEZI